MTPSLLLLVAGVVLLVLGAEGLVRGGAAWARRLGVTPLVIGLTVVAFGTSAPELVVSVRAGFAGNGAIAVANVVGSNIANVLLILALSALVRPLTVRLQVVRVDIPIMIVVSLAAAGLLADGTLGRAEALLLVAGLVGYTVLGVRLARREVDDAGFAEFEEAIAPSARTAATEAVRLVGGVLLLAGGAELFVRGAVTLAARLGVAESVIGLTVVAVGTSLPELATSLMAAVRRESDIAVGNVVGSNIFNLLGILGGAALARPLVFEGVGGFDLLVMLAAALLVLPLARSGLRLGRGEAALLLGGYVAYVVRLVLVG